MTDQKQTGVAEEVKQLAEKAKAACRHLRALSTEQKNQALLQMAANIRSEAEQLKAKNRLDLEAGREKGLSEALLDRLELTDKRIEQMASGLEEIAQMRDPVGEVVSQWRRPGGFEVGQVRIPLGVIGMIYESRPNVTADAAGLCFKAGNATLLRGGSEAFHSNQAIATAIQKGLESAGVTPDAVQLIGTTDRSAVGAMLKLNHQIDVVIPRGGKTLIKRVVEESTIPVIKHYEGICHVFIHREADLDMALDIAVNAKAQRPGTCNAMETLLVDEPLAGEFLPRLADRFKEAGVTVHGCPETAKYMPVAKEASEEDYQTEYLALTCNVRVVKDIEQAMDHIAKYGSNHTESIVTRSYEMARKFIREVDSSSVMANASTRLADGGVYGLGAEIGISTDKLHAYGPMGVEELTAKKFVVYGEGTLRI